MSYFFECFDCTKVSPVMSADADTNVCPGCGSPNGRRVERSQFDKAYEAGTYYDIDPKTGGRAKKKRR